MADPCWNDNWSKRAAACNGFRVMDGMFDSHGNERVSEAGSSRGKWTGNNVDPWAEMSVPDEYEDSEIRPDLTDPDTLGCLKHLCVERYGDRFRLKPDVVLSTGGFAGIEGEDREICHSTGERWRAECMVMALELGV